MFFCGAVHIKFFFSLFDRLVATNGCLSKKKKKGKKWWGRMNKKDVPLAVTVILRFVNLNYVYK